jgi:F plasmid transfer operon, TraF, protein
MPKSRAPRIAALLAAIFAGSAAQASPFGIVDPRSMAMGGTGVSSATSGNAAYFNPALLASAQRKDRFSFELMGGLRVADPNKLSDDVDRVGGAGDRLDTALTQFNNATTLPAQQTAAGSLAGALGGFRTELSTVSNKALETNLFISPFTLGVPGKDLGWGIYAAARTGLGARLVFDNADNALLGNYQTAAQTFADSGLATDLTALLNTFGNGTTVQDPVLLSRLEVRGAVVGEVGIPLAREFQTAWDNFALGMTPKYMKVMTFDYSVSPQSADITADMGRKDYAGMNFDLGATKDLGSGFKAGLAVRNLLGRDYATALGNTIKLRPQVQGGVSHHTPWTTLALDLDLVENTPLGFDKPSRFAGVGAELDLWGWLHFRVGYRADLSGNYGSMPTAGLGVSIFGLHIDLAAAKRGNQEVTAALQLGLRF